MPTYAYTCPKCGLLEREEKMSDSRMTRCPACGRSIEIVLFPSSLVFKGPGFYQTDYKNKNGKRRN